MARLFTRQVGFEAIVLVAAAIPGALLMLGAWGIFPKEMPHIWTVVLIVGFAIWATIVMLASKSPKR